MSKEELVDVRIEQLRDEFEDGMNPGKESFDKLFEIILDIDQKSLANEWEIDRLKRIINQLKKALD